MTDNDHSLTYSFAHSYIKLYTVMTIFGNIQHFVIIIIIMCPQMLEVQCIFYEVSVYSQLLGYFPLWCPFLLSSCTKCNAGIGMGFTHFRGWKVAPEACQFRQKLVNFIEFHLNIIFFIYYLESWKLFCNVFVDAHFLSVHTSEWWQ